jgi:hypothetical protein
VLLEEQVEMVVLVVERPLLLEVRRHLDQQEVTGLTEAMVAMLAPLEKLAAVVVVVVVAVAVATENTKRTVTIQNQLPSQL